MTSREAAGLGEAGQRGGGVAFAQTHSEGPETDGEDSEDLGSGLPPVIDQLDLGHGERITEYGTD